MGGVCSCDNESRKDLPESFKDEEISKIGINDMFKERGSYTS